MPTRQDFDDAIKAYWGAKVLQLENSKIAGAVGAGTAGSVRGGKHFDALAALLAAFFVEAGYTEADIHYGGRGGLALPGFYRPQKDWDLVVVHDGVLVAAIELKALGGPSYGNNFNNRVEEALGSAVDVRRAALAELYPKEKPWLGYFFVMQDGPGSQRPVKLRASAVAPEPVWEDTSYQQRFGILGERMLAEGLYDAMCYVVSSSESPAPQEPVAALDWAHFSASMIARLTYLTELGYPRS